jgi:hypothetical protein
MTTTSAERVHSSGSPRWRGRPRQYQGEAQRLYAIDRDRPVLPWSWITTSCDVHYCLDTECMTLHAPKVIAYPMGVCIYCGNPGGTRDHLLPEPITGGALRGLVAVVPACGNCNSRIGDYPSANVAERRRKAQLSIERGSARLLLSPHKTDADLMELGHLLRTVAIKNNRKREVVRLRLSWPDDPFYDLRAFQKSGIEDPESLGLCDALATPLRPEYAADEAPT